MPVSLTPRERAHLKARAHALEPKVHDRSLRRDARRDRRNRPRAHRARVDQGEDPGRRPRGAGDDGRTRSAPRPTRRPFSVWARSSRCGGQSPRRRNEARALVPALAIVAGLAIRGARGRSDDASGRPDRQGKRHRQSRAAHLRHSRRQRRSRPQRRHHRRLSRHAGDRSGTRQAQRRNGAARSREGQQEHRALSSRPPTITPSTPPASWHFQLRRSTSTPPCRTKSKCAPGRS